MTNLDAIIEAKRRWGADGAAWYADGDDPVSPCEVGVREPSGREARHVVYGRGNDWAEAFKSATANGH